jgi:hypothetical protein
MRRVLTFDSYQPGESCHTSGTSTRPKRLTELLDEQVRPTSPITPTPTPRHASWVEIANGLEPCMDGPLAERINVPT